MKKNALHLLLWTLGLGLTAASSAFAVGHDVALGSDGTIYQVRAGLYGDLFPNGNAAAPANPVIALDVTKPDGTTQRLLEPDSAGTQIESSPSVVFEDDSQTVFLLWESAINVHPVLELTGFDGTNWSQAITIVGNPFAAKTASQFTITRDSYTLPDASGNPVLRHRTILHLIWQEEGAGNLLETFYSPIIINDGAYIGWNPVYNLDDFLPPASPTASVAAAAIQPSLLAAPLVQSGRDARTVVISYTSPVLAQLAAIEVDVLPEQLMQLSDDARSHIIDIGIASYPSDLPGLADKARSHIIDIGVAFHPEVAQAIADQVQAQILADTSGNLLTLADAARSHIIDIGATLADRGLQSTSANTALTQMIEVDNTPDPTQPPDATQAPYHLFQIRVPSILPAPRVGPGPVQMFVSQTGGDITVSWAQSDRLLYRNSQTGGWSDPLTLLFSSSMDINAAYSILDQRIHHR
jgi:hypothetical protein